MLTNRRRKAVIFAEQKQAVFIPVCSRAFVCVCVCSPGVVFLVSGDVRRRAAGDYKLAFTPRPRQSARGRTMEKDASRRLGSPAPVACMQLELEEASLYVIQTPESQWQKAWHHRQLSCSAHLSSRWWTNISHQVETRRSDDAVKRESGRDGHGPPMIHLRSWTDSDGQPAGSLEINTLALHAIISKKKVLEQIIWKKQNKRNIHMKLLHVYY